jgi:serine/threonine protein kinase
MAPEQVVGEDHPLSNMWALGVILFLMVSGCPPFTGSSDTKVAESVKDLNYTMEREVSVSIFCRLDVGLDLAAL